MTERIVEETQREAIINRPHNLAGSVKRIEKERFNVSENAIEYSNCIIVPALLKLFQEALDNPIDVAIKGGCTKIDINVTNEYIEVTDNGYGISTEKDENNEYDFVKALCKYNTSSNYGDNKGQGQKGINGIGIKLCTTLCYLLLATTEDKKAKLTLKVTENNLNYEVKEVKKRGKTGVSIKFYPDFNIFDATEIDEAHIKRMYEYTLFQALTYPNINFTFNKKRVQYTPKKFIELLSDVSIVDTHDDYFVAVVPNQTDDFKQISYVNGLETSKGGTHVDFITDNLTYKLREKLIKKFKSIKPGDIKNKLTVIIVAKNVKQIDWDGQTKESITTPKKYFSSYFDIDFDKIVNKILRTPEIINPITEVYRIKEEFEKRKELKDLSKPKKKIRSDQYLPATSEKKYLIYSEGLSATGGGYPVFGNEEFGWFSGKGVPMNIWDAPQSKFAANKELSDFYNIAKNEGYDKLIIFSDADADGDHIAMLLIGFIKKYLPEYIDNTYKLETPVMACTKNNKIVSWSYSLDNPLVPNKGEHMMYLKGIGSWNKDDLKHVIKVDGLDNMLLKVNFDDDETIDNWLSNSKSDIRKDFVNSQTFDINKI